MTDDQLGDDVGYAQLRKPRPRAAPQIVNREIGQSDVFDSLEEISNEILLKLDQKDLVLVKGSRAIRLDKLVDSLKRSLM